MFVLFFYLLLMPRLIMNHLPSFFRSMNRLNSLPRGFGAFPILEVLDLTYNNLNERGLPGNFFCLETLRWVDGICFFLFSLIMSNAACVPYFTHHPDPAHLCRALFLGDNDFETLPAEIGNLKNLQVKIDLDPNKAGYTAQDAPSRRSFLLRK